MDDHLRAIQSVTDAGLGHLGVEALLDEVLDRVVDILVVDTAAVLLLEPGSGYLLARAARGLEEEVRLGARIPLGRGFAGRIAAERRPIVIDRVDETTVANPILWGKGLRAMLGVPMLTAGRVLGVLHVGTLGDRRFDEHDIELLQLAADRIAGAVQETLNSSERAAAQVLQRSLLPSGFPHCPGLEFAARYVPAHGGRVGGDWYDVFMLPSGEVWLVAGDVAGHGLRAAVIMSRVRTTIRAYALEGHPPQEVLRLTDLKLLQFEPGEMATAVCATMQPPYEYVRLAAAGHLPPVLGNPDGPSHFVDMHLAPPLGTGHRTTARPVSVRIPDDCVLVVYTDGLVERRSEPIEVGLERLLDAIACEDPERVCSRVMDSLVGSYLTEDDIALAAVRRT